MKVAIIGYGWVGKHMHEMFPDAYIHSPGVIKREGQWVEGVPAKEWRGVHEAASKVEAGKADVAFIGVPTPNPNRGKLDTSIVEEVISWCEAKLIVVRSTVNPGDCDRWAKRYGKKIIMQPEYLGETPNHPLLDPKAKQFLVIGGEPEDRRKLIDLYTTYYNANVTIRQVSRLEAEVVKLTENRAIGFKVAQIHELYETCEKAGVDFYTIRDAVFGDDPRFNLWWTFIFPGQIGFNSKCIPKDVYAWAAWAESVGYEPRITNDILHKNELWLRQNQ